MSWKGIVQETVALTTAGVPTGRENPPVSTWTFTAEHVTPRLRSDSWALDVAAAPACPAVLAIEACLAASRAAASTAVVATVMRPTMTANIRTRAMTPMMIVVSAVLLPRSLFILHLLGC